MESNCLLLEADRLRSAELHSLATADDRSFFFLPLSYRIVISLVTRETGEPLTSNLLEPAACKRLVHGAREKIKPFGNP